MKILKGSWSYITKGEFKVTHMFILTTLFPSKRSNPMKNLFLLKLFQHLLFKCMVLPVNTWGCFLFWV